MTLWRHHQEGRRPSGPAGWYCAQDGARRFHSDGLVVSVLEMAAEFVISARSYSVSLLRMALRIHSASKATEGHTNARAKLLAETLMGLYWMMSGLWRYYLKPTRGAG